MGNRKDSFMESRASSLLLTGMDSTASVFGPSTSGRSHSRCQSHGRHGATTEASDTSSTWVWVLPPCSEAAAALSSRRAAAVAAAATGTGLPWKTTYDGSSHSVSSSGSGSYSQEGAWLQPWRLWAQRHHHSRSLAACSDDGAAINGSGRGDGGANFSRTALLASLSTSAVAALRVADGSSSSSRRTGGGDAAGAGRVAATIPGAGASTGPRPGFHLPQLSIMRLPGSPSFAEDQDLAQELLDYHTAKHGGFPRPCPRCNSHEFMVRRPEATADPAAPGGDANASSSAGAGSGGAGAGAGVVEWRSRPLRCETCGRWVHLGCAGVELAELVPPRPWFHCRACRDTYLRLEAAAERNPHPSSASPTHALYLLTPADHAAAESAAAAAGVRGGGGAARVCLLGGRGPAGAVVPLLAEGFNPDAIQGFGQPAREYDGGKYSAVLLSRGQPVAAATFNVFGSEAQLCLLATAVQHRLKGNGTALVTDLENILGSLGVARLLVQARGPALPLWLGRLGYEVVPPEETESLHRRLPLAYYDCALLHKQLSAHSGSGAGFARPLAHPPTH